MGIDLEWDREPGENPADQKSAPYHFGQRLRRLRKVRGLSQRDLGRKIGQPRSAIGRWEKQLGVPRWSTVVLLATNLRCEATKLLPLGDKAEGASQFPEATKLLPAREREIDQLKGEIESLRKLIVEMVQAAETAKKDPKERRRVDIAWMKMKEEAARIKHDDITKAVESIVVEDS